jgi:hypothetical protein
LSCPASAVALARAIAGGLFGQSGSAGGGTILTVSDVIRDPDDPDTRMLGDEAWYRLPEDELIARIDLTIGASLTAAEALARG